MTDDSTQNIIQEHMRKLPEGVRSAIHASDWERKILTIGRRYGLHVDQLEVLQTELSLAVLGLSSREEFVKETMKEAHILSETMVKLVSDINTEIFEPIRVHLHENLEPEQNTISEIDNNADELRDGEIATLEKHGIELDTNEPRPLSQSEMFQKREYEKQETDLKTKNTDIEEKSFSQNSQETKRKRKLMVKSFSDLLEGGSDVLFQSQNEDPSSVKALEYTEQEGYTPEDVNHLGSYEPQNTQGFTSKKDVSYSVDPYREPVE